MPWLTKNIRLGLFSMELVKNKASGKYFVVLDDSGVADFLVVTPEGKVKRLERRLFDPQYPIDPMDLLWGRNFTKTQIDIYREYFDE